jgi:hypothetical protein
MWTGTIAAQSSVRQQIAGIGAVATKQLLVLKARFLSMYINVFSHEL